MGVPVPSCVRRPETAPPSPEDERATIEAEEADAPEEGSVGEGREAPERLKSITESLLFASDKPLSLKRIQELTGELDVEKVRAAVEWLRADYADRGVVLHEVSGGYQFRTNTQFSTWVQQLIAGRPVRLSRAQLETLAIVAYRQPVTRAAVERIRGVDSDYTMRTLLHRRLIVELGRSEAPGRPYLYGTSFEFLERFGLTSLEELPALDPSVAERLAEEGGDALAEPLFEDDGTGAPLVDPAAEGAADPAASADTASGD